MGPVLFGSILYCHKGWTGIHKAFGKVPSLQIYSIPDVVARRGNCTILYFGFVRKPSSFQNKYTRFHHLYRGIRMHFITSLLCILWIFHSLIHSPCFVPFPVGNQNIDVLWVHTSGLFSELEIFIFLLAMHFQHWYFCMFNPDFFWYDKSLTTVSH